MLPDVLIEFNLIGANGGGSFPRRVRAEIQSNAEGRNGSQPPPRIAGKILDLDDEHALEIRSAEEHFGERVIAVIRGWGYRFKSLDAGGAFELEKNWA